MTHKDIYTKFMIEYDKANVTSSYPSLTKYEIATILDKAYLALIGQKITGNNPRRAGFEADIKAIEDIRPLIKSESKPLIKTEGYISNQYECAVPSDSLYTLSVDINLDYGIVRPMDNEGKRTWPAIAISHEIAQKFFSTPYNMPWIKQPVYYMEGNKIYMLVDSMWYKLYDIEHMATAIIRFIDVPNRFALDPDSDNKTDFESTTTFELSDSMAEELINLAIMMALENVESPRLQTKAQMRTLEA